MMLNRFVSTLLLAFMFAAIVVPFQAQAQTSSGGYKIGVVDIQVVVRDYKKREQEYQKLQQEVNERQKEIDSLSTEIEGMKEQYKQKQESGASSEELFELESRVETRYATYQSQLSILQREIDRMEAEVLEAVFSDIEKAITEYANSNNYHIILNGRGGPRGTVLYHAPAVDVTSDILTKLNG